MIISHTKRFAFVSTMKCATNSLTHVLLTRYDGTMPGGLHDRRMELVPDGYFTFSVCRNPYTRAVSLWWSTCMRNDRDRYGFRRACPDPDSFEGFMTWLIGLRDLPHDLLLTQSEWHRHTRIDRFLEIECLEEQFASLPFVSAGERIGFFNATLTPKQGVLDLDGLKSGNGTVNTSVRSQRPRAHASTYLTPRAAARVRAWAGEDFARFGYSTDPACVIDLPGSQEQG